jgi:hypothetical protein
MQTFQAFSIEKAKERKGTAPDQCKSYTQFEKQIGQSRVCTGNEAEVATRAKSWSAGFAVKGAMAAKTSLLQKGLETGVAAGYIVNNLTSACFIER